MKNLEELKIMRDKAQKDLALRSGKHNIKIVIGMGTCGIAAGARETMNEFLNLILKSERNDIVVTASGCFGFCVQEPMVHIYAEDQIPVTYHNVDVEAARLIFDEHVLNNKVVEQYIFQRGKTNE
ncbi:MAG: (2Fe-2S) ferredoxin domain-containing protein [Candidatus Atribacteria bacterium]|nr:(2Fe-2S) ferredoxin domain-containing protein [Candidatus Atribacteria bacterium]